MTSNELEIFKQSILDDVRVMMQTTGQVTQYIGARYVPLFADPLDWSNTMEYEPLTIVLHQGNSFTSRQFVPKGIDISDESFWANTGNYNAQIEQYREQVAHMAAKVDNIEVMLNTPAKNKYGFAVALIDGFTSEKSVKQRIDNALIAGANHVCVCATMGETQMQTPVDIINYTLSYAHEKKLSLSLKIHGFSTDPSAYQSIVTSLLDDISVKPQTVFVYNEPSPNYIAANKTAMINTITAVKNLGFKVGMPNTPVSITVAGDVNDACDIFAINMYPSMGYSLTYTVEGMMEKLSNQYLKMTAGVDKPIWVTETGILPKKCFLFAPEQYEVNKGYPPNSTVGRDTDYNVAASYYRAAIKALSSSCDMLVLWYGETSLTKEVAEYVRSA